MRSGNRVIRGKVPKAATQAAAAAVDEFDTVDWFEISIFQE